MDSKVEIQRKNFIWNLVGTTLNSMNSLFYMMIVTRINGITDSGVFTLSFSLACLFYVVGGYEGRVFQVTDAGKQFKEKEYIIHRYLTCSITLLLVFVYTVINGYDFYRFGITLMLCILKLLEALSETYYAILQKNNKLYLVGKSLLIKSLLSLVVFFVIDFYTNDLYLSCVSSILVWLILLVYYDIPKSRPYYKLEGKSELKNIFLIFKEGFYPFIVLFVAIYLVNASKYALDTRVNSDLQAIYGIILMPATFLSLATQYLIQPILTQLMKAYNLKNIRLFTKMIKKYIAIIFFFGLICLVVAFFLGIPVLNLVYGIELNEYRTELCIIIFGAIFYSGSTFLSSVLTTARFTFEQFLVSVLCSVIAFVVSPILIDKVLLFGAAVSYFLVMLIQFIGYSILCYRRFS